MWGLTHLGHVEGFVCCCSNINVNRRLGKHFTCSVYNNMGPVRAGSSPGGGVPVLCSSEAK